MSYFNFFKFSINLGITFVVLSYIYGMLKNLSCWTSMLCMNNIMFAREILVGLLVGQLIGGEIRTISDETKIIKFTIL